MSNYDENEFKEITESERNADHTDVIRSGQGGSDHHREKPEAKCYICGRPESVTGPLMRIPNNICICKDCMQKTFDSMNNAGFPMGDFGFSFGGFPNMNLSVNNGKEDEEDEKEEGER